MTSRRMFWITVAMLAVGVAFGTAAVMPPMERSAGVEDQMPRYINGGELARPKDYRRWIFVGASLGLSYSPSASPTRTKMFHHTYLAPHAYDAFLRTGEFPDKTMLVLELYEPGEKADPATCGLFESQRRAVEVAVKDRERFPDPGWAYFSFGEGRPETASAPPFPASAGCVACHRDHAGHDNVFTQFYPVLRERH
jgi:hypothetical protein